MSRTFYHQRPRHGNARLAYSGAPEGLGRGDVGARPDTNHQWQRRRNRRRLPMMADESTPSIFGSQMTSINPRGHWLPAGRNCLLTAACSACPPSPPPHAEPSSSARTISRPAASSGHQHARPAQSSQRFAGACCAQQACYSDLVCHPADAGMPLATASAAGHLHACAGCPSHAAMPLQRHQNLLSIPLALRDDR